MTTISLSPKEQRFPLGIVDMSEAVNGRVMAEDVSMALARHAIGDWGDVSEEDWAQNDFTLVTGGYRLFSEYHDRNGVEFWIITDSDRTRTSISLSGRRLGKKISDIIKHHHDQQ